MLDGAVVIPLQTTFWNLIFEIAALLWMIDRALLNVGYFIQTITGWLTQNAFAPMLAVVGEQTGALIAPVFVIAMTVLGFTYLMAVFGRFEVVNFRAAFLWLLFAGILFSTGPSIYTGMEDLRRLISGGFYEIGVDAFNDASSATGLAAIGTSPGDSVASPTDQFGQFLVGVPGASAVDGLDVAMAYVEADGYDVLAAAGSPHPIARLPWSMVENGADGFFDPDTGPNAFASMTDAQRQEAIAKGIQGLWRCFTMIFIAIFGIIEQLVNFLMAASFAIAFFSMFIAVLFGFFRRTEPIAWGAFNLIVELFVQSIINSLLMSLILGFVLVGANTGNAILLLGASLVGLWMSWNLLQGCIKGLTNSTERLYRNFSAATGGNFATVSETNKSMGDATVSSLTGASTLMSGGSMLQALGATFGDNRTAQTMNYAARMLGGEDTLLGSAAQAIGEGASARSLAGPLGGYLLGQQNRRDSQEKRLERERRDTIYDEDSRQDAAVSAYYETGERSRLNDDFDALDVPRVQALAENYDEDEFQSAKQAVRRVRNLNPELSPQSPQFLSKVRAELPAQARNMEAPALQAFAELFGEVPQPTAYAQSLANHMPDSAAITLGSADLTRDQAVDAYKQGNSSSLNDAFSPDDAQRLAQLIDAYDDDDFAAVVYAVRSARESHPDAQANSLTRLQASRRLLPNNLQQMPSRDLSAFSQAFGTSAQPAIVKDEEEASTIYLGQADQVRDTVVDAYRDGDESAQILEQVYNPKQARTVRKLADDYGRDDFDAVVQSVRQARTADPDMQAGSPYALRAARKRLPQHLRQMPSEDLAAFSRNFGESADIASTGDSEGLLRPRSRRRVPDEQSLQGAHEILGNQSSNSSSISVDELPASPSRSAQYAAPSVPPALATEAEKALGLAAPTILTPLAGLRGMKASQRNRLEQTGISSMELLADTPVHAIAATAKVSEERAQEWRSAAKTVVKAQAAKTRQQIIEIESQPTGIPIQAMPGLAQRRIQRLAAENITTMETLVQADTAQIAQVLRVSPTQVATWQQNAQQVLQNQNTSSQPVVSIPNNLVSTAPQGFSQPQAVSDASTLNKSSSAENSGNKNNG
jgi:hypothetical protein